MKTKAEEIKEKVDLNIDDLLKRIDRLTSGNVGHSRNQIKYQLNCIRGFINELVDQTRQETIIEAKEELLKQTFLMTHKNGYPSEAVPKATILSLESLMENKTVTKCTRCGAKNKPLKNGLCYGCTVLTDH